MNENVKKTRANKNESKAKTEKLCVERERELLSENSPS